MWDNNRLDCPSKQYFIVITLSFPYTINSLFEEQEEMFCISFLLSSGDKVTVLRPALESSSKL